MERSPGAPELARRGRGEAASFSALGRLMQTVEDTTALHRCGRAGLLRLREDGARLERLVSVGAHVAFLHDRNALYRRNEPHDGWRRRSRSTQT